MKKWVKNLVGLTVVAVVSFGLFSFSCTGKKVLGSANTAFADTTPAVSIPADSLSVMEAMQNVFRAISNEVLPSVVEIDVTETKKRPANPLGDIPFYFFGIPQDQDEGRREYKEQGLGSGVIVRRSGDTVFVLTNNHVAGSATKISVKLNDGREFDAKLVGADERMDVALVSFESSDKTIKVATLGDSDKVQTGDICFAMGAPLGYSQSVTEGIVSATGRSGGGIGNINDFLQTDTAINQGNSGGPLLNIYGEVIGINTWIASQSGGSQGLGFAIPVNNIKHAIDDFIKNGKVSYGWLGVSLVELNKDYLDSLGVKNVKGAFASQLFIDSPAQKAGMQAGDFITELNGEKVRNVDQLVRRVGSLKSGDNANFKVIRSGKEITLNIKIEERKKDVAADNARLWPGFIAIPLNDDIRKELKIADDKVEGVAVTNVQPKSPAAALRLQNGDIITAVNGKEVKSLSEFYGALDTTKNKSIQFDVWSEAGTVTTGSYKF